MRKLLVLLLLVLAVALPVSAQRESACAAPVAGVHLLSPGTIRGFDPQPDPPALFSAAPSTGLAEVGFNPQPDPPHDRFRITARLCDGSV
ncbi:MAG: hypothetical protein ABI835_07910 [Chloroflexota bacterium]